ncbi:PREDICTED: cytochrome P450 CYP736A12-like [Nicotiana attenuata]|uniref:cytochrome P450 CYP736A12-like n=1 Tax=Nicotiana attenuata TaxID=49451 RepID=UPI000904A9ED|nr:PREDICTED: cytochrome P450 CYP736A12-like [Nicotiana attenuata]
MKLLEFFVKCWEQGEVCDVGIQPMAMTNNLICRLSMSTRTSTNFNESTQIREIASGISSRNETGTTSVGFQWAIAELLNHPKALKKVQEEIDRVVGLNRLVEDSDIQNLSYLQAVVKETLRAHAGAIKVETRKSDVFKITEEQRDVKGVCVQFSDRANGITPGLG